MNKNIFIVICILFCISNLISCFSSPAIYQSQFVGGVAKEKIKIDIEYNMTESRAHSLIKIWLSQIFPIGNKLDVDDYENSIIAGSVNYERIYNYSVKYRIFLENGTASLYIDWINIFGLVYAEDRNSANEELAPLLDKWLTNITNSYKTIF